MFTRSCLFVLLLSSCATPQIAVKESPPPTAQPIATTATQTLLAAQIVAAPDRTDDDRKLDAGRHPAELLEFLKLIPGQKVADLAAGGGYTTELLARAVGPSGVVYGHNTPLVLKRFAERPWSERLGRPVMKNVVRVDREFDDPLPPEARELDLVLMVLFYHDTVWQGVDREKMNRNILAALKSGGAFVIVDSSGRPGSGLTETKSLHRIEESVVRSEVTHAGFRLAEEGSFLKNPGDARDWNSSPTAAGERRGTSDRFVLKFVKP